MAEEAIPDWLSYLLTVYRHPLRYRESLRTAMLPLGDMTLVLRIAGGDTQAVDGHCTAADIEPDNLREAALFFTEQFCFAPAADYYRTLGLPVDADEERIKEHYRLLMRLFHPDRPASRGAWTDGYARRVNQAYNTLRHAKRRQAYRRSLEHSAKTPILDIKAPLRRRQPFSAQPIRFFFPLRWLSPPLVMGMVATLALLFVLMVYLANSPIPPAGPALSKERTASPASVANSPSTVQFPYTRSTEGR